MYHLPLAAAAEVRVITNERICREAALAVQGDRDDHGRKSRHPVVVVQVGDVYVVADPAEQIGEFSPVVVFDERFRTVLARVAG